VFKKRFVLFFIVAVFIVAVPASAQGDPQVVADGLRNPRNFSFDADGNLYVAEAGVAGDQLTEDGETYGATARISMITPDGEVETVVDGLISFRESDSLGAHAVKVTDESVWVLLGQNMYRKVPFSHALVELDTETGRVKTFVDLLSVELEQDPDGSGTQQANPVDFEIMEDGSVLIADASCNCLISWSADAGPSVAVAWEWETDNPVPTSVEIGPDGDIYVGFLTGFPFPQEGSRIERWSGGELVQTYEGLTGVTGLEVTADGSIYAVEFGESFDPNSGWAPGRVVRVTEDGVETVVDGLTSPYGIEMGPDGQLYVSTNSIGDADGQIISIAMQ
jgi:hypothetical protein